VRRLKCENIVHRSDSMLVYFEFLQGVGYFVLVFKINVVISVILALGIAIIDNAE